MKKIFFGLIATLAFAGCKATGDSNSGSGISANTAVVESATAAISAIPDDQAGAAMAKADTKLMDLIFPRAYASTCKRPYYATCSSGLKSETYSDCAVSLGTLDGSADLTYSDAGCSMAGVSDTVTRTYDLTYSGPHGGTLTASSASATDYNGNTYGGGGTLTTTGANAWDLDVAGHHQSISVGGVELYSVSARTLATMSMTGSMSRSGRTIDGGQLEVNHNLAKFTAVFTPHNLAWVSGCCHPTSGTMDVTFTGTKTGTATVTFDSTCGSASITQNGSTEDLSLSYCE